jgi:hypothetical protein
VSPATTRGSRIDRHHRLEAPDEQPAADEQREGHRHLADDEHRARSARRGRGAPIREGHSEIRARERPCRHEAKRQAARKRDGESEEEDGGVKAWWRDARQRSADHFRQEGQRHGRDHRASDGAADGKDRGFDQQLAPEPSGTGADGRAHGQLSLPLARPREQQVCDVRARDQQDECDGAERREQNRPGRSHELVTQWPHVERPSRRIGVVRRA